MASPSIIPELTDNEIDEEIMNEDLKHLGIGDDLSNMDLQEKKNLLSAIKESAETNSDIETTPEKQDSTDTKMNSESPNNSSINSIDFPDLPKPKNTRNKLILSTKNYGKKNNLESQSPNLDRPRKQFCLPFCDDDDDPPLVFPEDCPIVINAKKNPQETYGRGYEEREREIRSMIDENDSWLRLYSKLRALRQLKTSELTKETVKKTMFEEEEKEEDEEEKSPQKTESVTSQSSTKVEDDIYAFISEESCTVTSKQDEPHAQTIENTLKGKSTVKKTNNPTIEEVPQMDQNDDIFKSTPLSPFSISDMENQSWSVASRTRHRHKPGKFSTLKKSSAPEVEMNFNEKWNPQTGTWDSSQSHKYTTRSTNRNQESSLNKSNIKEKQTAEIKVQCPICQQDFLQSKIENHAAECDIFISEGTSNKPDTRMSDNEVSSLPGPSGQKKNQRGHNKRGN